MGVAMHIIETLVLDDAWQRTDTFCPDSTMLWPSVLELCAECALFCSTVVPIGDLKQLLQQAIAILQTEATVVDLPAPCKVFGDIHGQFTDLKKFFKTYGVFCARLNRYLG